MCNFLKFTSVKSFQDDNLLIKSFMKGIFTMRPALPRYGITWDVGQVLAFLRTQFPLRRLTLRELAQKLAMLLALLSGHRGQSLHMLEVGAIECNDKALIMRFNRVLKTTQPGRHVCEAVLPAYEKDLALCVVKTYRAYIIRTKPYRKGKGRLFLSTRHISQSSVTPFQIDQTCYATCRDRFRNF